MVFDFPRLATGPEVHPLQMCAPIVGREPSRTIQERIVTNTVQRARWASIRMLRARIHPPTATTVPLALIRSTLAKHPSQHAQIALLARTPKNLAHQISTTVCRVLMARILQKLARIHTVIVSSVLGVHGLIQQGRHHSVCVKTACQANTQTRGLLFPFQRAGTALRASFPVCLQSKMSVSAPTVLWVSTRMFPGQHS